jgi:hypothetical protein
MIPMSALFFGLFGLSFKIMVGLVAGLAIGAFQEWATRRSTDGATSDPRALQLRLGMLRVAVPILAFVVLWKFSLMTLIAAGLAFKFGRNLIVPQLESAKGSAERGSNE